MWWTVVKFNSEQEWLRFHAKAVRWVSAIPTSEREVISDSDDTFTKPPEPTAPSSATTLNKRRKWSYDDLTTLRKGIGDDLTSEQMATLLGRTASAVRQKIFDMGWTEKQQNSHQQQSRTRNHLINGKRSGESLLAKLKEKYSNGNAVLRFTLSDVGCCLSEIGYDPAGASGRITQLIKDNAVKRVVRGEYQLVGGV